MRTFRALSLLVVQCEAVASSLAWRYGQLEISLINVLRLVCLKSKIVALCVGVMCLARCNAFLEP